ncbi:hypothetical protein FIM1_4164 [Kluyveromyces marxianus]|uniref:Uncharacterized protein n=1 Tax=Kluyveromyces marxianus TaxID=4911 RepID=A0ABX6EZD1_KLUMA|nr:hypothetical protein FIM1_4164 [Kluyveromyces marxianus]
MRFTIYLGKRGNPLARHYPAHTYIHTPVHRIPNPNVFVFFLPGERGNRRAARFAAQVRSAQHGASGQKRRLALHSMASGANTMAICGQRVWKRLGARRPLEGKKKGGLFFFRRSPRARARNFWSSACEPHSTLNDRPTTCQGGPIFTLVLTNCNFPYISTFQKHVFSVPSARHLDIILYFSSNRKHIVRETQQPSI